MPQPRKAIRRPAGAQRQTNQVDDDIEEEIDENPETEDGAVTDSTNDNGGTATGEDVSDDDDDDDVSTDSVSTESTPEVQERIPTRPRDGRTYRVGEDVIFKGEKRGGIIIASENIYRAVKSPGTDRWRFHLLLSKHSQIPASKVKELQEGEYQANDPQVH